MIKKVLVLSLLIIMLLSGCGRYGHSNEVSDHKDPVGDKDLTEIILDENPTTGYSWSYSLEPKGIVKVVKEEYRPVGDPDADGAGGEHIWFLKGLKEGTATMTFIYSFEGDGEDVSGDPVVYEIKVGSDKGIVEAGESHDKP